MGKIKSSIITAILVIAIVVLAFFSVVSFPIPGSNNVKRYNSFLSSIHLGADLSGEAQVLLYPEGVISAAHYNLVVNDAESDEKDEYVDTYEPYNGVYVEKEKVGKDFADSVLHDAEVIAARLGEKGYSSFSVTVEDGYVIKISVPTNFSYSAYRGNNSDVRSECLTEISHTITYVMMDGELSLRDGSSYDSSNSLLKSTEDFVSYIKKVDKYSMGGTHAVRITLTDEGFEKLNKALVSADSGTAYFYVGETSLGLQLTMGTPLEEKQLMFQTTEGYVTDFTSIFKTLLDNKVLENKFNDDGINSTSIVAMSPSFGEYAAIYLAVLLLLAVIVAIVYPVVRYKKLGIVNALMVLAYALTLVIACLLLEIQVTIASALTALLGLALLTFTNIIVFEAIRKETKSGRTMQAAVKTGYKKTIATVLDLHIVLVVLSLLFALIGVGEIASCGFIFFIATLASYILYWFTRFMWYVISSPVRDKFGFAGFKREVYDDED